MGSLINLCHLDIQHVPLEKMPPKICNLKDLQTLSDFVVGKNGGPSIKELGALRFLSGELTISGLQNVDVVENVQESYLKDKEYLIKLVCCWGLNDHTDDSKNDKEVLDSLQPHPNLKELVIAGYRVETFPSWLEHCLYTNMVSVHLLSCYECRVLPPFGQLPSLQQLHIRGCHGVQGIGAEFYSDGSFSNIKPFRSLKWFYLGYMLELREWSFPESCEDGGCFPSLEHLSIWECPELNVCLPDYFPSLKELDVRDCEQIATLQGIQQMQKFFPRLDFLNIEKCPELETFLLSNFPSNLKEAQLSCYEPCHDRGFVILGCEDVRTFPKALHSVALTRLHIKKLWNLEALNGEGFQFFPCLEELIIDDCDKLQCFPGECLPASLTTLHLEDLPELEDLGKGLEHLISVKELSIERCNNLRCLSESGLPPSLTCLTLFRLPRLEDIGKGFFQHLTSLEELSIFGCGNLKYESQEEVNGKGGGLKNLNSLKHLEIGFSERLLGLLEEGLPTSLTSLLIALFQNLIDLNRIGFQHLNSLEKLEIRFCENLQCLPEQGLPSSLSYLEIVECPLLTPRCQKGSGSDWHKIANISHVKIWPS